MSLDLTNEYQTYKSIEVGDQFPKHRQAGIPLGRMGLQNHCSETGRAEVIF